MKNKYYMLLYCDKSSKNIHNTQNLLIHKLKKKFKKFFLLNYYYLNSSNIFENKNDQKALSQNLEPKNILDLKKFSKNKQIICILIDNFGTNLPNLRTFFIFKKLNFKIIKIKNIHTINQKDKIIFKSLFKSIKYNLRKIYYNWCITFLRSLNILPKFEIYFLSDKEEFLKIKNSIFFKYKLTNYKKVEIINSNSYDTFKNKKPRIDNKFIVLLDDFFDHPSSIKLRGKISNLYIKKHYILLNNFLKKIKKLFKKKIIICIHPKDNLEKKKNIFKNFQVVQFQTPKYIFRSYLILFFDTTSIIDGIYLKKKMLAIYSNYNDENVKYHINGYKLNLNIQNQIINDLNFTKNEILKKSKKPIKSFKNYKFSKINPDGKELGINKILKEISKI